MIFTVTSPSAVQGGFTVAFSLADVTTNATDHAAFPSGVLTFAGTAGETQTITVVVNGDTTIEANETFTATLGTVTGATATQSAAIGTGAVGTGTINNDDSETLDDHEPDGHRRERRHREHGVHGHLRRARSRAASRWPSALADVTTNATDHAAFPSGVLTFAGTAGETQTITVVVNGDTTIEANETLTVTLGRRRRHHGHAGGGHHHGAVGTGTITNDDSETLTITSPTVTEGECRHREHGVHGHVAERGSGRLHGGLQRWPT